MMVARRRHYVSDDGLSRDGNGAGLRIGRCFGPDKNFRRKGQTKRILAQSRKSGETRKKVNWASDGSEGVKLGRRATRQAAS